MTSILPTGRPMVIAEAGVNHNGDIDLAFQLVDVAAAAGADAVKFQTFKTDKVVSPLAPKAEYQVSATGGGENQMEMLRRLELPEEAFRRIQAHCRARGILFLSTPFDEGCADFLEQLDVPVFKIPSGEVTNLPLVSHIAAKNRPIIMSTGMCDLEEVRVAVDTIRRISDAELIVLHCLTNYPADPAETNLKAMVAMAESLDLPVGYSDHTPGIEISLAAVALGACVIEKHFTLDRSLPGPDHSASLDPKELSALVHGARMVASALGDGIKRPAPSELGNRDVARRSLVAAVDIAAGTVIGEADIAVLRPGTGLAPSRRAEVIGHTARTAILMGTPITLEMLD